MIDLHSHILPGVDDGAKSLDVSLQMARIAVADGIRVMACTPHIYPGLYMNDAQGIRAARESLQAELDANGIDLKLVDGADVHLVPGLIEGLRAGSIPTINGTRYLLLEPSHHIAPPRFAELVFNLVAAEYVPIITHPERLVWIDDHFPVFEQLVRQGAWMQVTAGALTGVFGPRAKHWGERFLRHGLTHVLASDAHSDGRRSPVLSAARRIAADLLGEEEADALTVGRPQAVLDDLPPSHAAALPELPRRSGFMALFGRH